jgi:dTDP-4-dehydrorhamnose 3,5-epimerase
VNVVTTALPGVLIVEPRVFTDNRGSFLETYHRDRYAEAGIPTTFVQDNHSRSAGPVLRGLHYQLRAPQAKLVTVIAGAIFDVAVDVRRGSPTFGHWAGAHLTGDNHHQIFIPRGFAHGFCVLSDTADVVYKCDDLYRPGDEFGVLWSDPAIGIDWPVTDPILSEKDAACSVLSAIDPDLLPAYDPTS